MPSTWYNGLRGRLQVENWDAVPTVEFCASKRAKKPEILPSCTLFREFLPCPENIQLYFCKSWRKIEPKLSLYLYTFTVLMPIDKFFGVLAVPRDNYFIQLFCSLCWSEGIEGTGLKIWDGGSILFLLHFFSFLQNMPLSYGKPECLIFPAFSLSSTLDAMRIPTIPRNRQ